MRRLRAYWMEDKAFFLGWTFLQWVLGWGERLNLGPFGMHQGAQADRAGVAWNFYHETFNLFLPRVMENRAAEGIAGMEFPILSYWVGMVWRLVGHHDVFYRLLVGILVTLGYWSIWRLLKSIGIVGLGRIAIILMTFLSPVMVFYTWNFLPDPAALGLSFAALYQWYKWRVLDHQDSRYTGLVVWVLFSLSGLIKVSMLIPFFTLIILELLNSSMLDTIRFFGLKPAVKMRKTEYGDTIVIDDFNEPSGNNRFSLQQIGFWKLLSVYLGVLVTVFAWYGYSNWLTNATWNIHFIQQINPVGSLSELVDLLNFVEGVWLESLFFGSALFWMLFLWVFSLLKKRGSWDLWDYFSCISFFGFVGFFLLFSKQFRFHDYYFLCGWTFVWSALLVIFRTQLWGRAVFVGFTGLVSVYFFVYYPLRGVGHCSKMLTYRFERGNYYCQNIIEDERGLRDIGSMLNQRLDPNQVKEVLVMGDPSPSASLYFLQRKGLRFAPDFDSVDCRGIWNKRMSLESGIGDVGLQWKWPWDYRYGKRRTLGYVVVENNYIDTLGISTYIVDIKDNSNLIYTSGAWSLFSIPDAK